MELACVESLSAQDNENDEKKHTEILNLGLAYLHKWLAGGYGNLVRVAFDLYRGEILKQMRTELPTDRTSERTLWEYLANRLYAFKRMPDLVWPPKTDSTTPRFAFKNADGATAQPKTQLIESSTRGLPKITVKRELLSGARRRAPASPPSAAVVPGAIQDLTRRRGRLDSCPVY